MRTSPEFITVLMAGCMSLLCVSGRKEDYGTQCENTAVQLTAHRGGSLTFQCKYTKPGTNTIIGLCREDEDFKCKSLISARKAPITKTDRYTLKYSDLEPEKYTVEISKLEPEDAGKYRCEMAGVEYHHKCLTEFQLQILDWHEIPAKTVSGRPMKYVDITCYYPEIHEGNEKFLCKGPSPFDCTELIHTTNEVKRVSKGRIQIRENQRTKHFNVHISKLTTEDAGTYWCGSDRTWKQAEFNKTLLTVEDKSDLSGSSQDEDESVDQHSDDQDKDESNADKSGLIGGMAGALVLILMLTVGLILIKFSPFKTQACCAARGSSEQEPNTDRNTQGDHGEHVYDEIQEQQGSSGGKPQTVYVTVKPPTEGIHYASINVHTGSVNVSTGEDAAPVQIKNGSSACVYSTVVTHGPSHPLEEE